jgi:ankyrin repeat protein
MLAAQNGHELCLRVLLEAKADPNKATSDGETALMFAAQNGHELCLRVLLEAGAVELPDADRKSNPACGVMCCALM